MKNMGEVTEGVLLTTEDQLDGDSAEELASFIDDMNAEQHAETQISVLRIPTDSRGTPLPNSKHMGQLFTELLGRSTVNDVIERIRREYIRPGETSITVRIIGKKPGERRLLFNRIYTIEKPETPKTQGEGTVAEMLRLMQQNADAQAQRTENFMREMLAMQQRAQVVQPVDPIDQMTKMLTAFAPVMAAVAGRPIPESRGNSAAELLATVKVLKEASNVFGGGGGDDSGSTLSTVKAVAEAVAPGLKFLAAKAETDRMTAAERIRRLPPPEKVVTPTPAPPRARPKPATAKTPPAAPPKAAPAPNNNPEGEDVNLKDLREKLQLVATMADEGQTPEAVAELIVDNCEDDELEELYRRVEPTNFVRQMSVLAPSAVRGREAWFEKLRVAILAQYEDDPDAVDVPADGGDGSSPEELAEDPVDVDSIPDVTN